jgi:hypothetical protein
MEVRPFSDTDVAAWDELVERSPMATLLHTRRFLSYHGDRFKDASTLVHDDRGRLVGAFPAAPDPDEPQAVVSHPGATYGGLVHDGSLTGGRALEALTSIASHYASCGYRQLQYRPVPWIYHRRPSGDDLYALFRLDAHRVRCDLSCAVDVHEGAKPSARRRRGLRKAERAGIQVVAGRSVVPDLWAVVESNLASRHDARPVHSLAEIMMLARLFPEHISFVTAELHGATVAGVVLFESHRTTHAQYIASTPAGNAVGALDSVFAACLEQAKEDGRRFFDFGTSNRKAGRILAETLFDYKAQFGGGGVAYERYELSLTSRTPASPE